MEWNGFFWFSIRRDGRSKRPVKSCRLNIGLFFIGYLRNSGRELLPPRKQTATRCLPPNNSFLCLLPRQNRSIATCLLLLIPVKIVRVGVSILLLFILPAALSMSDMRPVTVSMGRGWYSIYRPLKISKTENVPRMSSVDTVFFSDNSPPRTFLTLNVRPLTVSRVRREKRRCRFENGRNRKDGY